MTNVNNKTISTKRLKGIVESAIAIAKEYRLITGKPMGITGEVGEFLVADLMNLNLMEARQPGYDAVSKNDRKIQIKARCIIPGKKGSQRLGSIKLDHSWDTVMLIIMNMDYEPQEILEAKRNSIKKELTKPGSKARNERGALSINKFRSIATSVWRA